MINTLKSNTRLSSKEIYEFLQTYLDNEIKTSLRLMRNDEAFEKTAWSERQAFQLGVQKALFKLKGVIPSSDKEGEVIE